MKAIIDRFEGDFAICEIDEGKFINILREKYPDAREGDEIDLPFDDLDCQNR